MIGLRTAAATAFTASKSPCEAIGKPASITSTPSFSSWCAITSFSSRFMLQPGDCSPSRRVVSKIRTRSADIAHGLLFGLGRRVRLAVFGFLRSIHHSTGPEIRYAMPAPNSIGSWFKSTTTSVSRISTSIG